MPYDGIGDARERESSAFAVGYSAMEDVNKGLIERVLDWAWRKERGDSEAVTIEIEIEADYDLPSEKSNGFFLWKSGDMLHWLSVFSNNIRDDDVPKQEIITADSQVNFVKKVTEGEWPYPEAWHWHEPLWMWGKSTFVANDIQDDIVFSIAGGYVLPGREFMAEALAKTAGAHKVSHGMPMSDVVYKDDDDTVIVQHRTSEISSLPSDKAANQFTFISTSTKENRNMITDEKRAEAAKVLGMPEGKLRELEAVNAQHAEDAKSQGRDTKEVSEATATQEADGVKMHEIAESIKALTDATTHAVTVMSERVAKLEQDIVSMKASIDKDKADMTPSAAIYQRIVSAVGAAETKVDGRSSLARKGPEETRETPAAAGNATGISFVDGLIMGNKEHYNGQ